MARGKKHSAEQIVNLLRQIENGKTTALGCKEAEITEQTYYRWRKEYGGLKVDQARRLKELSPQQAKTACRGPRLEQENAKLKRLVSELSLEKLVLKDIAAGNF
jgi:putative transposase